MQTFEEILNIARRRQEKTITKMGQELAADIVKEVKKLGPDQTELKKELNKQRISALNLKLIQGGKE
jgi:hypothetical protein